MRRAWSPTSGSFGFPGEIQERVDGKVERENDEFRNCVSARPPRISIAVQPHDLGRGREGGKGVLSLII